MDQVNQARKAFFTTLRRISNPKGDILHALKQSDQGFAGFGEAYFTHVHIGETKGWKKHTRMQLNLIVPVGSVCFYVYDEDLGRTETYQLSHDNYGRLTVPPGLWVAFKGLGQPVNMVLNVASIEHDPQEALTVPLDAFPFAGEA
jgi:dTDP-4-dehydrorhamnose 3,5-epimerase